MKLKSTRTPNVKGTMQDFLLCMVFVFFLINYVVKAMWSQRHEKQWLQNKSIQCAKASKQTNKSKEWGKAVNQRTGEQRQKITILLCSIPYYVLTGNWNRKKMQIKPTTTVWESCPVPLPLCPPVIHIKFWFCTAVWWFLRYIKKWCMFNISEGSCPEMI